MACVVTEPTAKGLCIGLANSAAEKAPPTKAFIRIFGMGCPLCIRGSPAAKRSTLAVLKNLPASLVDRSDTFASKQISGDDVLFPAGPSARRCRWHIHARGKSGPIAATSGVIAAIRDRPQAALSTDNFVAEALRAKRAGSCRRDGAGT